MKALFESQDLWEIITDEYEEPTTEQEAAYTVEQKVNLKVQRKKDKKALFLIYQGLNDSTFKQITEVTSFGEMESQPNAGVENHNGRQTNHNEHQTNHNEHQTNHNEETISHPYDFIPEAPKEVKPIVGMVFISENVAYDFYNEYARWCGFSIRKGSTRNSMKTGKTIMQSFICSKEGYRHRKHIEATDHKKRPRAMTRCDCKAKIVVHKNGSDRWEVKTFVEAHSHNLMSPSKVHYLRSHRHFTDSHKVVMDNMRKAGIGVAKVLNFFTNEAGGPEKMGFIDEDARNALKI
ncbi:protein FAR1-RELATED SEQUENCE 5-like [Magnolia sinica]|uniref:protein FAR1-RELATED SEQUENCE 5-like n=1 Tax=Magnolia sinica TaxID=86752 RepID=UPI0026590726|nr:protein FAR1-RELATED SEQUENCE 5-like [Magnolia sinica]